MPAPADKAPHDSLIVSLGVAMALSIALGWTLAGNVWTTGAFGDTDDATRMVQVRDWISGQAWYDLRMYRLGLPGAPDMHWSRIVDVPIALLLKLFGLGLEADLAERAARIAFPLILCFGVYCIGLLITTELIGAANLLPASVVLGLIGLTALQFQPGRIDHHAPQVLLLILAILFMLRATTAERARTNAFLCAASIALSLSISLENLPSFAVIGATFPALWVLEGRTRRDQLLGFGLGLLLVTPVIFAATVPPWRWLVPACDAFSSAHIAPLLCAGAICILLAATRSKSLDSKAARTGALLLFLLPVGLVAVLFPQCLGDPYVGIDPVVRRHWLDHVHEAQSIWSAWASGLHWTIVACFAPPLLGMIGIVLALRHSAGEQRLRWILFLAVAASTIVVASMRVAFVQPMQVVTCLGVVYLLSILPRRLRELRIPLAFGLSVAIISFILPSDTSDAANGAQCNRPQDAAGLNQIANGVLLSPIDQGAFLLAFTQHQIIAAPYHRNNEGNRIAADTFSMPAEEALNLIKQTGIEYLAICKTTARRSPLVTELANGRSFSGLQKLDLPGGFDAWRVLK